jgi:hypothetical protein
VLYLSGYFSAVSDAELWLIGPGFTPTQLLVTVPGDEVRRLVEDGSAEPLLTVTLDSATGQARAVLSLVEWSG